MLRNPIKYVGELHSEIDGIGSTREYITPSEDTRKALGLSEGDTIEVDPVAEGLDLSGLDDAMNDPDRRATVVFAVREENGDPVAEYVAEPLADE